MKHLIITTPYGDKFRVNEQGLITQYKNKEFSGGWKMHGIASVTNMRVAFGLTFPNINEERIKELNLLYKNGNPRFTVEDIDHGNSRVWGNTKYHGIKTLHYEEVEG